MAVDLWVYGDESGIGRNSPHCVVAGYIASSKQWASFNEAWQKVIREAGVEEFHSHYFFHRHAARNFGTKNPFRHWSDSKAQKFLGDLLKVIHDHKRVTPIGSAIDAASFFSFSWGERQFLTGGQWNRITKKFVSAGAASHTYAVPFFSLVGEALQNAQPPDCKVHFVMDEQTVIQNGIQQLFARARSTDLIQPEPRSKLGDLTPGLSHQHPGIQAADLLAYAWYSYYAYLDKLSGERLDALVGVARDQQEIGIIKTRGLEYIIERNIHPEDHPLLAATRSPAEIQREKR